LAIARLSDDFFRRESARIVSQLVSAFGPSHLQLAEDVAQEAMLKALRTWPLSGMPENPGGWLAQTAKNLALDTLRRDQLLKRKQIDMFGSVHRWSAPVHERDLDHVGEQVEDSMLRMMFVCCHPAVPEHSRPVLALKTLCGFGTREVALALFSSEAAIAKRLTRAKEALAEADVPAELPLGEGLDDRLDAVLTTLYLLFNEGYKATGEQLIKADLCAEAIRLARLLVGMPFGDVPRAHALLALILFNAARLSSRTADDGRMLLLRDQDRSLWNRQMIEEGQRHLARSACGTKLDAYHLQAAIAATHCSAESFETTNWAQIVQLYDLLVSLEPTAITRLNRAVARGMQEGPEAGLAELSQLETANALQNYYLFHAAKAEFHSMLGETEQARSAWQRALESVPSGPERSFIESHLTKIS
jgi:RNA polymerase sigma factor (sigma-70 family)